MALVREGYYQVEISEADWFPTKAGTGHYLKIGFKIIGHSEYDKKTIYQIFNFDNPNPKAVEIARNTWNFLLSAIKLDIKNYPAPDKDGISKQTRLAITLQELTIELKHKPGDNGYTNYVVWRYHPAKYSPLLTKSNNNAPAKTYVDNTQPPEDDAPPPEKDKFFDGLYDNLPF